MVSSPWLSVRYCSLCSVRNAETGALARRFRFWSGRVAAGVDAAVSVTAS
jgi:hypothetical protein